MDMVRSRDTSYIVDGFLVVYDIVVPSYSRLPVLAEVMVCRLDRAGRFAGVVEFLSRKAKESGAVMIVAGTALSFNDRALARLYTNAGFSQEGASLAKVI